MTVVPTIPRNSASFWIKQNLRIDKKDGVSPYYRHDNSRPYTDPQTVKKLDYLFWIVIKQPAYSPDLSPCDHHMFGTLKEELGRHRFNR